MQELVTRIVNFRCVRAYNTNMTKTLLITRTNATGCWYCSEPTARWTSFNADRHGVPLDIEIYNKPGCAKTCVNPMHLWGPGYPRHIEPKNKTVHEPEPRARKLTDAEKRTRDALASAKDEVRKKQLELNRRAKAQASERRRIKLAEQSRKELAQLETMIARGQKAANKKAPAPREKSKAPACPPVPAPAPKAVGRKVTKGTRAVSYEHEGRMWTIKELCEQYGVKSHTLRGRLANGMAVGDAVSVQPSDHKNKGNPRHVYKGVNYTARELADLAGVNLNTMIWRLREGWDVDEAVEGGGRKTYQYHGKRCTITQLAALSEISAQGIVTRIKRGMTVEEAVDSPMRRRSKSKAD